VLGLPLARSAERFVFDPTDGAAAPDLLNAEVLHVLRRRERRGLLDSSRSRQALEALLDLPITRYPTLALLDRAWGLRANLTGHDAMYAALAEALGTGLVTVDGRLASAARDHGRISVVLLS
jgi:predicted nucleic acid-binding protein